MKRRSFLRVCRLYRTDQPSDLNLYGMSSRRHGGRGSSHTPVRASKKFEPLLDALA
jgi:hypothetical protein